MGGQIEGRENEREKRRGETDGRRGNAKLLHKRIIQEDVPVGFWGILQSPPVHLVLNPLQCDSYSMRVETLPV